MRTLKVACGRHLWNAHRGPLTPLALYTQGLVAPAQIGFKKRKQSLLNVIPGLFPTCLARSKSTSDR
jgi:hypothetical protein